MFEGLVIICMVNTFGVDSSNRCFLDEIGKYEKQSSCDLEIAKQQLKWIRSFREQFGDDYMYVTNSACISESNV
jgi:hypothetical protein